MKTCASLALLLLTASLPILPTGVQAQVAVTSLAAGDRIRFETAPGVRLSGQLIRLEGDSLTFSTRDAPEVLLPLGQLQGLQVARARPVGALNGALIGLAGGFLIGGLLTAAALGQGDEGISDREWFRLGGTVMALPGTIVGAVVGRKRSVTRWIDVSLRP